MTAEPERSSRLRIGVAQMNSGPHVDANLEQMAQLARQAREADCDLVIYPENAPLLAPEQERLREAEPIDGTQMNFCGDLASAFSMGLLVGSFAELSETDAYRTWNTSVLFNRKGRVVGSYRKIHLFDVEVGDDTSFRESRSTLAGDPVATVLDFEGWKIGMSICYDLRFPELYRQLAEQGADLIVVPAAFTFRTGSAHWEVLLRARAIENLTWVAAPAQVGRPYGNRESWGHSMIIGPWGDIVAQAHEPGPSLLVFDIDREATERARAQLPSLKHRRL